MKKLTGFFFAGLTVAVLAGGCSQGKKESAEPIPQTKTKAVRMDTVIQRPKKFESIHKEELEQHETSGNKSRSPKP
jgi:hypothetical protein